MLSELKNQPIMSFKKCCIMWFFQVRGRPSSISWYLKNDTILDTVLQAYHSVIKLFEFCIDLGQTKGCRIGYGEVRNVIFFLIC